jgi:hypothetical protein
MSDPATQELWAFLTDSARVAQMIEATNIGHPAITPLLAEIETRFSAFLSSDAQRDDDAAVLVNNMILQIMTHEGCDHLACGLCPQGRFIKVSGVYRARD